uniref:G-protein coupled receptors family 1 profile domain-containing protein n=1 Tax=Globodera rostochiensis TaxID=31243 RepID=A0A914H1Y4_GLORO
MHGKSIRSLHEFGGLIINVSRSTHSSRLLLADVLHEHLVSFSLRAPNSSIAFSSPPIHDQRIIPFANVLKASALTLLVAWTILANFLVFIVLYKNPRLQTVPNLLVGNLAFSDFCLALVVLPLSSIYACAGEWIFNDKLCQLFVSADILCSTASIWNLCIVGLDRYWAITHPVQYLNKRNKKTACLMILSVWSFSALISLAPLLGWKQVAEHGNLVQIDGVWQCTFLDLPSYTVYSATGSFFIPTLLMFFVYFKIYQAFAKHRARQIYRQKVIRRHIESTILHEISHILPTSDEFAKEVEDEEEEDEAEEEEEEEHGRDAVDEHVQLEHDREKAQRGRRVADPLHPIIYEENEEAEAKEENGSANREEQMKGSGAGHILRRKLEERNGRATNANKVSTAKVAFKREVDMPEQQQKVSILVKSEKQRRWFSYGDEPPVAGSANTVESTKAGGLARNAGTDRCHRPKNRPKDGASMPPYEKVRRHKRRKELNFRKSLQGKPRAISAAKERRGVRVLGIILGCFTLCWMPFFIMYVVLQFCSDCSVNPHIEMFITWLGYSNSGMNPIIYTVFNRDYQIALKRLFIAKKRSVTGSSVVTGETGRPRKRHILPTINRPHLTESG